MFQAVRDEKTRRAMGEHYTSEKDILKTLNPLFLEELQEIFHSAHGEPEEAKKLRALRKRIAGIKFMDPACGCGNFIIIAYRELRALETAIISRLVELGAIESNRDGFLLSLESNQDQNKKTLGYDPMVTIDNFYGIEIDPWPAAIARTAMFLIERQADRLLAEKFGYVPTRLPISQESHIVTADALLADWEQILPAEKKDEVYIAGNPPFIGQKERTVSQTSAMKAVWGQQYDGYLDFVTSWFKKSIDYFDNLESKGREFSFVSTNSIVQGQPVAPLFDYIYSQGWDFKFAYQSFPWEAEAAVHCVITGFTKKRKVQQKIYRFNWKDREFVESLVKYSINPYLVDSVKIINRKRMRPLNENLPLVSRGSQPADGKGNLLVDDSEYEEFYQDSTARKYLRPFRMTREFIYGENRWCLWFVGASLGEIAKSPVVVNRLKSVSEYRQSSSKKSTREKAQIPHLFDEIKQPNFDYLAIPVVISENYRYFVSDYLSQDVIAGNKLFTVDDSDGFAFSIISSSMFITWQKAVGGRLEMRLSFSNTIVWNNLPLPPVPADLRAEIIQAGQRVLEAREEARKTAGKKLSLAELYKLDAMPEGLIAAHNALDLLVDQAFGAQEPLRSNEERLQLLFKQYQAMTLAEEKAKAKKASGRKKRGK